MKKYKVNVNGFAYEVEIEEIGGDNVRPMTYGSPQVSAPQPMAPATLQPTPKPTTSTGDQVSAPMQGKIIDVKVSVGEQVVAGQVIAILEAMKMENEIIATSDGSVTAVGVTAGQSVEAGDMIIALG